MSKKDNYIKEDSNNHGPVRWSLTLKNVGEQLTEQSAYN